MNDDYVFVSPRGIKTTITKHHLNEAYAVLLSAGLDMHEAHAESLDYVIHRLTLAEIPLQDLLYNTHSAQESNHYCSRIATLLAHRGVNLPEHQYI